MTSPRLEARLKRELELVCSLAVEHDLERALAPELFRADRVVREALTTGVQCAARRAVRELRALRSTVDRAAGGQPAGGRQGAALQHPRGTDAEGTQDTAAEDSAPSR